MAENESLIEEELIQKLSDPKYTYRTDIRDLALLKVSDARMPKGRR